jgi:pimeloyl-ACP methyl ester carboxylesterase
MDQRGHGLSGNPGTYSFDEVTADALGLANKLALEKPVVVGHSWGASVALQYAVSYPEVTAGAVLVDGGVFDMSARLTWEEAEVLMRPPELDGVPVDIFVENARKWPDVASIWSDEVQDLILSNLEVRDGRIYRRLPIPEHMKIVRELWELKTQTLFGEVNCPVLIIPAMKTEGDPQRAAWMKGKLEAIEKARESIAQATVVVMEETIHDIPVQRPKELAGVISEFASGLS